MQTCPCYSIINLYKSIVQLNMQQHFRPYRSGTIRFLVLFLVSMAVFGNQYAFNNPQALEEYMQEDLHIGQTQFQLLYTIFAFPNIFATFFIGYLIDFLGVRIGIIALAAGVAIFQLVIAIGGYTYSYKTILVGRMLFGLASQSLVTAQASMVAFWFKGKQLAFALGIAVTFPQLGNAFNSWLTPIIYESSQSLGTPLLVSVFICIVCLICAIAAAYIDKKADKYDEQNKIVVIESMTEASSHQKQEIKCADLKKLNRTFWLLVFLCMFAVGLYVPFMDGANKLFAERFCFTPVSAGKALVITYLVAAGCSAPIGLLIDKFGFKRYFIMICMVIFTIAQFIILVYPQCEGQQLNGAISGLILIGLGYCLYGNCILPSIPLVVSKKITGTAFGIMQMIESLALAFFPLINGQLIEKGNNSPQHNGYKNSSLFFFLVGLVGILLSMCLLMIPDRYKRKLDRASSQKFKVQQGKQGEIIFSASQAEDNQEGKKKIEISNVSNQNLNAGLLSPSTKQANAQL